MLLILLFMIYWKRIQKIIIISETEESELIIVKSSYKDKIKDLRNTAQETQAAIKIQDKLNELKSKDVVISSYRWIWELIQNAKDCPNSTGKIDIEIEFDSEKKEIVFKHNGKLFATKNLVYLIEQVSTKERTRESKSTGKFGTGFLTTNLLSAIVDVSGYLQDNDETEIAEFEVTIDRSGDSIDELKKSIKDSCDQLEANTRNISNKIDEMAMNTVFRYRLDTEGVNVAKVGLDNFEITAPYVFAFVNEINKITIVNDNNVSEYTRTKDGETQSENTFVSRIHKSGCEKNINIFTIQNESCILAVEINQEDYGNHVAPYDTQIPRLFCDFPLLGTHDFSFPVVINSREFEPTEPRNGIVLYGNKSQHNKDILKEACILYSSMIEYFLHNDYKDIYNVVQIFSVEGKDWIDKEWYNNEIIVSLKEIIKKFPIFHMVNGEIKALENDILLLSDDDEKIRDEVWKLSSELYPNKHICKNEIEKWYLSLWEECRNYGILELINNVEKIGSFSELQQLNSNSVEWMQNFYSLIYEKCSDKTDISKRDNKIFPNQHGDFCYISSLKKDINIDEAYKDAALLIDIDLRAELMDKRIQFNTSETMEFNDVAYRLINKSQEYFTDPVNFYKKIVGMIKSNSDNTTQNDFIILFNSLYSSDNICITNVYWTNERLINNSVDYLCKKICQEISEYDNLNEVTYHFPFESNTETETWISNFVAFLVKKDKTELLDKYAIIPNQNGVLCSVSKLYKDSDNIPEFLKDVSCVAGTDIKEDLVSKAIDVSGIIPRKKGFKDISEIITCYIRKHKNNISVSADEKEAFNQTYKWLRDNKEDESINSCFSELLEHLYWFYNDDEISESIAKASELENILKKYGLSDIYQLDNLLNRKEVQKHSTVSIEEVLARYGISSNEELQKLIDSRVLDEEFIHNSEANFEKFEFVQKIINRTIENVKKHLISIGYSLDDSVQLHKTIFTATIGGREIYIIARPSDYNEVILYYDAEIDTLDYTKDFELWIENGNSIPEKLTFGKILRLTGVNKIPLRRI